MTKPKPRPQRAVDAVRQALDKEGAKRNGRLKPIEIVKVALCAYQAHVHAHADEEPTAVESADRTGLRRGTQAAADRLLFNANYWLAAYEDRIVAACDPEDADELLKAVAVWGTHTLKLNTLANSEAIATFERFCPPFAENKRRGSGTGRGRGPVAEFEQQARIVAKANPEQAQALVAIARDMRHEAAVYEALPAASALDALFAILPAWCLKDDIALVSGGWWDDADLMLLLANELRQRFIQLGYGDAPCQYFHDSMLEAIDAYQQYVSSNESPLSKLSIPELLSIIHAAREANPHFETDGYGNALPAWLAAKEQLVWNTIVCPLYGPENARPLLAATPGLLAPRSTAARAARADVITELAHSSFARYRADRSESGDDRGYASFADQPQDLRNSSIEHIKSIPDKLAVLGYEVVPDGSCYPNQKVLSFTPSEVECLAILEHRRWIAERERAGWIFAEARDAEAKTSPYLVPWEQLPDRAREWNRSAVRNIPALLASENLAITRK